MERRRRNLAPYSVGKDRRMEAVHDMADKLLCAAIVDLFLPAILIEDAVETEADVLRLFALHWHVGLLERRHGVGLGRVEDKDALVEHFEHLAQGPRTPRRLRSRIDRRTCRGGSGCIVGIEEGRSGIIIRVEEQSFLLREGSYADCACGIRGSVCPLSRPWSLGDSPATEIEDDMARGLNVD